MTEVTVATSVTGQIDLRAETIDRTVKGFALQEYKFKRVVTISPSSAWKESYFQEGSTELTAQGTKSIRGVPRLANFPYGEPNWQKKSAFIEKYAFEGIVAYEDEITNEIDVIARTLLRISRGVAKSVDDQIWAVISESQSASTINSVAIAAGSEWDSATISNRNPVNNILNAKQLIEENDYPTDSGFLLLNPKNYRNLMSWLFDQGANAPRVGESVIDGKRFQNLLGLTIIVSRSVTADYALVVGTTEAATWKTLKALTTETIVDPGIKKTIRAWEFGVTQLINPKAITLISNTDA